MLEPLTATGLPGRDGWYETSYVSEGGLLARILRTTDERPRSKPELTYSSLLGTPITRGDNITVDQPAASASEKIKILEYEQDKAGPDVVSTNSVFSFETSYIKANCTVQRSFYEPAFLLLQDAQNASKTNWNGTYETVDNGRGLTIAYDA